MRAIRTTLYSVAAPLMLFMPGVMNFNVGEIGDYLRGDEFRLVISDVLYQVVAAVADTIILGFLSLLFGVTGG